MKKVIVYVLLICCFQSLISCLPKQEDTDETLAIPPPKQLTAGQIASKNDTSKCVFSTGYGRVTVTLDPGVSVSPVPRGYFDYDITDGDGTGITLTHYNSSGYDDEMRLYFNNTIGNGLNDVSEGVYGATYEYGNGRVNITAKYMTSSSSYRSVWPLDGQKVYIKYINHGLYEYEVIFCNFKMKWEYSSNQFTTITLNGKVLVYP